MTYPVIHTNIEGKQNTIEINRKEYLVKGIEQQRQRQIMIEGEEQSITLTIDGENNVTLLAMYQRTTTPSLLKLCAKYYKIG